MKFSIIAVTLAATSGLVAAYPAVDSRSMYARAYDDLVEFSTRAIWGQGKYAMDESDYHISVKPGLKAAFAAHYSNFVSLCGSNPDFHCDRKGFVSASAADKKKKTTCTHSKFPALQLGDSHVLPHIRRSSSPEPHHRRSYVDIFDDLD